VNHIFKEAQVFNARRIVARILFALVAALLLSTSDTLAQTSPDGLWTPEAVPAIAVAQPPAPQTYRLDRQGLETLLAQAPPEGVVSAVLLSVPTPDGQFRVFRIEQSPVMTGELAARFPAIATFRGQVVEGEPATIRFSRTPLGFQATVVSTDGVFFVQPTSLRELDLYVSKRADGPLTEGFECLVAAFGSPVGDGGGFAIAALTPSGATLRTYRLAVAATGEYTQYFGGQANAMAAIATTVNGINAIYNIDVASHLVLVANNAAIVFEDPDTDPFPLSDLNTETQAAIDAAIGNANYDIGHLFHRAGASISGNAGCIGCICTTGTKGSAWSRGPTPEDGNFVFLVAHEMGHQYGANHTWNGTGCGGEESVARYEPGSGTTIMSYSSICGADNIQGNQVGDLYFHAGSRAQITAYTGTGGGNACGTVTNTGNSIPTVSAGGPFTIPQGTPFVLTATGNDPDGHSLTFTWEQYDIGDKAPLTQVDNGNIPLFRSFSPVATPSRTFPQFADLLAGSGSLFPGKLGEQLPSTDRTLTFRVTARDNVMSGGAADADETSITVLGAPFRLTTPTAGGALECNVPTDIAWDVGGGNVSPFIDVRLSRDGGMSFPTLLAASTGNLGAASVTAAPPLSTTARLRLDSNNNIFFALSDEIAVADTLEPVVTAPMDVVLECTGPLTPVNLGLATSADVCEGALPVTNDAPAAGFPVGNTVVTWSSQDSSGNVGSATQNVAIQDTTPPLLELSASPAVLWAPNHQMVPITITVTVEDLCDPAPTVTLLSITSNEPDNGLGDGNTSNDIQEAAFGTDDREFLLRAERSGLGDGRVYTITYQAKDASGNTTVVSTQVVVPHDRW
jgi:hypothetical protein